ncbi:ROK family transcriptional regulator [Amphibacillus indicireducens]|uniref:Xylose repressor n=1 Tax=Amphibacillus indicireducens TaxID=1076330 RepID=A0ABP7W0M4_9BACI
MKRGSFQQMKAVNKSIILTKILNDGPISRAQIAKETKLTPPTVGTIVKELIEQKMVVESSQGQSQGGRKPTMLVINQNGHYMIGIDAGPSNIDAVLTDLSGKIFTHIKTNLTLPITEEEFLSKLIETIEAILQQSAEYEKDIIGIGVGMHGVVDAEKGESLFAPNLNLRQMPVADVLSTHFPYYVKVENDVRALALGEKWFGQGKNSERLVVVNIGNGVGSGVTIDGELYRGESHIAGEIGHMTIDLNGEQCTCGNRGCLQTFISGPAIAKRAHKRIEQGEQTSLREVEQLTALAVYQAAEAGDQVAQDILHQTGTYIGVGLINLIHTLNPSQIVLTGGVTKAKDYLMPNVRATINERGLTMRAKQTTVSVSDLGDHSTALGAVALIIGELFATNGKLTNE